MLLAAATDGSLWLWAGMAIAVFAILIIIVPNGTCYSVMAGIQVLLHVVGSLQMVHFTVNITTDSEQGRKYLVDRMMLQ